MTDVDHRGKAITSFVMSIVGFFIPFVGIPIMIIALIMGIIGRKSSKRGLAIAGVVISSVGLFLNVIALLAGILTPLIFKYTDEANETRALGDCRNIATALMLFHKDTGTWPYYNDCWEGRTRPPRVDYLYGNMGEFPRFSSEIKDSWGYVCEDMFYSLVTWGSGRCSWYEPRHDDDGNYPFNLSTGWKGPYLPYVTDDPWGFKYLVSVSGFGPDGTIPSNYVWCLSAGPNNVVDTPAWSTYVMKDDIGYRLLSSQFHFLSQKAVMGFLYDCAMFEYLSVCLGQAFVIDPQEKSFSEKCFL